jgi:hypothetical protein
MIQYFICEEKMMRRDASGIDHDSKGCQYIHLRLGEDQTQHRGYLATEEGMGSFTRWVKKQTVLKRLTGIRSGRALGFHVNISVAIRAGAMVFTVIASFESRAVYECVKLIKPAFDAA